MKLTCWPCALIVMIVFSLPAAADFVAVQDGQAKISGIYIAKNLAPNSFARFAAGDLAYVIEKMTGAKVAVVEIEKPETIPAGPAIVLGEIANSPVSKSPWKDISRTVVRADRLLISGESDIAINDAVFDLLYEQGVRFLMPANIEGNPGEIIPAKKTLAFSERDAEHHPFIRSRRIWGHNMGPADPKATPSMSPQWGRRNGGQSAVQIPAVHAWDGLVPKEKRKPEYYATRRYDEQGQPVRGGQFCVSNAEVADVVAQTLIERFKADPNLLAQSIAPNDGGGACICANCRNLDPPAYFEPSSGAPVLSDRYIYFFNRVAEKVAKEFPERYLAYLVYSDYCRPPIKHTTIHPMIMPIIAPIRYPRTQSMFNPLSEPNIRLKNEVATFAKYAKQIGLYGYNYNLAESIVPFSKISVWSDDLPYLAKMGLVNGTIECLGNWNTNGPHIYLSTRYLYSGQDPKAIMADYYEKLGGAAAKPIQAYWDAVDKAYRETDVLSGSIYGVERVLTPKLLAELKQHLDAAAKLAGTDREKRVVEMFQAGLRQGELLVSSINHLNSFEFTEAKKDRDTLRELNTALEKEKVVSLYPNKYMDWFLSQVVDSAAALPESGAKIAVKFPSQWRIRLDYYDVGTQEEWFNPTHGDTHWQIAKTWAAPSLYSQGFGDFLGAQWFKATVDVPAEGADKLMIWFGSNDGATRCWVNGQPVTFASKEKVPNSKTKEEKVVQSEEARKPWRAFSAPVGHLLKPGQPNTFVLRIDHRLNDLNLGGILRPILLYQPGDAEVKEIKDLYRRIDN